MVRAATRCDESPAACAGRWLARRQAHDARIHRRLVVFGWLACAGAAVVSTWASF
jgi:hypothetical protein